MNVSMQSEVEGRPIPQIATWRLRQQISPNSLYIQQSITNETWSTVTVIGDSNVFEYRPTQPIPVQTGDIVGIMMPVNETERKKSVKPVFLEGNTSMLSCARVLNIGSPNSNIIFLSEQSCSQGLQSSLRHIPLVTAIIGESTYYYHNLY